MSMSVSASQSQQQSQAGSQAPPRPMKPVIDPNAVRKTFPELVPEAADWSKLFGYVAVGVKKTPQPLRITLSPSLSIQAELALSDVLTPYRTLLTKRWEQKGRLEDFLEDLAELLAGLELPEQLGFNAGATLPPPSFYSQIVQELGALTRPSGPPGGAKGWNLVSEMDDAMKEVSLSMVDGGGRAHVAKLTFPPNYPVGAPKVHLVTPKEFVLRGWNGKLQDVVNQIDESLISLQEFWDVMDELDAGSWVLEPESPTREQVHRRLALGNYCSLALTVDPNSPRALPEVRFLGAEATIGPLRAKLNTNLDKWDDGAGLVINMSTVLGMELPSRTTKDGKEASAQEGLTAECGICYMYRLDDEATELPDRACDNPRCGRLFHNSCLAGWLSSLSNVRRSFDTLFGVCPYCDDIISVKALG